jgi:predicted N-acetyltransferase YhbS
MRKCVNTYEVKIGELMNKFRQANSSDIIRIEAIEKNCFPEDEAATLQSFQDRYARFPECFFVLEVDRIIVGHINGCIYHSPELPDELYSDPSLHCPNGKYQTVFGLAVEPEFQSKGYASILVKKFITVSRIRMHKGIVLTCKDNLIYYYQRFGFEHLGKSVSDHGGASWNDMLLTF